MNQQTAMPWLVVDVEGLRKTLERKGKWFAIYELIQNSWDEEKTTEVSVRLTRPKDGKSTLTCKDNSPTGYRDLSEAHTMFANSYKKSDPTKRGRFNVGEKHVIALCNESTITSTSGQIIFQADGSRTANPNKRTKAGSEFWGVLPLTIEEWVEINKRVVQILPPIVTTYNGKLIARRAPLHVFQTTLPTEIADDSGVLRQRQVETEVRLYEVGPNETATLYEKGIPVVEIGTKWHVDVQQKIPLNVDRDNVTQSYKKTLYVRLVNEMHEEIKTEEEAKQVWVDTALEDSRISTDAVKTIVKTSFGENAVAHNPNKPASTREAAAHSAPVVHGGSYSGPQWDNIRKAEALPLASDVFPTDVDTDSNKVVPPEKYDSDQVKFVRLIESVSPYLIEHKVSVRVINDKRTQILGCTEWKKDSYIFTINLAYQNTSNWQANFDLLIHELAHHKVQSNDHLNRVFVDTATMLGAKLAQLALDKPELFEETVLREQLAAD